MNSQLATIIPLPTRQFGSPVCVLLSFGLIFLLLGGCAGELPDLEGKKDPITATVSIGFDPQYSYHRSMMWMPVTAVLENDGEDVDGTFVIRFKDGTTEYREPVNLPSKSRITLKSLIHIGTMLPEVEFYLDTAFERKQVELISVSNQMVDTTKLVAVLSHERRSHQYLSQNPDSDLSEIRRVLYITPMTNATNEEVLPAVALLPNDALGYQTLNCLIWDNGPTDPLSNDQQQALDAWIQQGGTLVLAAGESWQELSASALRLYSPLNLDGSELLETGTTLVSQTPGIRPTLHRQSVIATGEMIEDEELNVLLTAEGLPLLIERPWGAGRIVFSAISLRTPIVADPVLQEIINMTITDSPPNLQPMVLNNLDTHVTAFLRWILQAQLPSTQFIAMYLGAYILLVVPVNYLVFKKLGRLEYAWLMVPVLAIIFAIGVYYIGALRQQSQIAINQVSVIETRPGANRASATTYSSIYSPVRQWYTLQFPDPMAYPQLATLYDFRNQGAQLSDEVLNIEYNDEGTTLNDFLIYHWSQRTLKTQQTISLGEGIDAEIYLRNGQLSGSITNNTGHSLEQILFEFGNTVYSHNVLYDGETLSLGPNNRISTESNAFLEQIRFQNVQIHQFRDQPTSWMKEEVQKRYLTEWNNYEEYEDMLLFTAMVRNAYLPIQINEDIVPPQGNSMIGMLVPVNRYQQRLELDESHFRPVLATRAENNAFVYSPLGDVEQSRLSVDIPPRQSYQFALISPGELDRNELQEVRMNVHYHLMIQRNSPNRGFMQPQQFRGVNKHPYGPSYELHVYNFVTNQFRPLSELLSGNGSLNSPEQFLNPTNTGFVFQLSPREEQITFDFESDLSLSVFLDLDLQSDSFLGRSTHETALRLRQAQM